MNPSNLIPWVRRGNAGAMRRDDRSDMLATQSNLNRVFDMLWRGPYAPISGALDAVLADAPIPRVDVRETDKDVVVTADLPGMDEKDVEIEAADGALTIRGQSERESTSDEDGYVLRERSIGRFERQVPLPDGLEVDAAAASLKNGLLTVTLPRSASSRARTKKIAIGKGKGGGTTTSS
jgi:HSP20 family protein